MDIKKLVIEELKKEGLDVAEDAAIGATKAIFRIIKTVVPQVSAGLGAIIVPMMDLVEPKVMEFLDKIDGEVG